MSSFRKFRRILKRVFITLFTVLALFITLVFIFQDKIIDLLIKEANKNIKGDVTYSDIDLHVFRNFPHLSIEAKNLVIHESPAGNPDTLAKIKRLYLSFDVFKLINGKFKFRKCEIINADINLVIDSLGNPNYLILKEGSSKSDKTLELSFKKIYLDKVRFNYQDFEKKQFIHLTANDSKVKLKLNEKTEIGGNLNIFFQKLQLGDQPILSEQTLSVQPSITIDNKTSDLSIENSIVSYHGSEFTVNGSINSSEEKLDLDIGTKNTTLSTLYSISGSPAAQNIKSNGDLYFDGKIDGSLNSPHMHFDFGFKNLSLFHPELNKKLSNASLTGSFDNGTQNSPSTSVLRLKNIKGKIDNNPFTGNVYIGNFNDPYLNLTFVGKSDFKAVMAFYPLPNIQNPVGDISLDIKVTGKVRELDSFSNPNVSTEGTIKIQDLGFLHKRSNLACKDINGSLRFYKRDLILDTLQGTAGNSNFLLKGKIEKPFNHVLDRSNPLRMKATFTSDYMDLQELLTLSSSDDELPSTSEYHFSLPKNVVLDFNCSVDKINFDRATKGHEYRNLNGNVLLNDRVIKYDAISFQMADGKVVLRNGTIDARNPERISVNTSANLDKVLLDSVFYLFRDFKQDMLGHKNLKGRVNTKIRAQLYYNDKLELLDRLMDVDAQVTLLETGALINFKPLTSIYDEMNSSSKIQKFLGLHAYKFFKTDDPSINAFQNLKFKPFETHDINIRKNIIDISQIDLESSAGNIKIFGNQNYINDSLDYNIDIQLKNYHRINKSKRHAEQFGRVIKDKSKGVWLYYKIIGTLNDYSTPPDWSRMVRQKGKKIKEAFSFPDHDDPDFLVPDADSTDYMIDDF